MKEKPAGTFADEWYVQITETKVIHWLKRLSKQIGIACKFEEGHEKNLNLAYEKEVIKPRAYQVKFTVNLHRLEYAVLTFYILVDYHEKSIERRNTIALQRFSKHPVSPSTIS